MIVTTVIGSVALLGVILLIVLIAQLAARQEVSRRDLEAHYRASNKNLNNGLREVIAQTVVPMGQYVEVS